MDAPEKYMVVGNDGQPRGAYASLKLAVEIAKRHNGTIYELLSVEGMIMRLKRLARFEHYKLVDGNLEVM